MLERILTTIGPTAWTVLVAFSAAMAAWIVGRSNGRKQGRQEAEHAQVSRTLEDIARAKEAERSLGAEPRNAERVQRFYRD